ncbi:hypothetical protein MRB53_010118 [Persea americana]|uniref:Uncharacterized protein n=1 Tax=Persea americana TaxID=3435 RepID=A0ACC2LR01_PERAE|nr:hypothetical protein MRB53_010118 [Persea americana]
MMVSYDTWLQHGELAQSDEPDDSEDESGEDDDNEEYLPPQGDLGSVSSNKDIGDDGDDESSSSQANMVTRTNQGKRSRHACVVAAALAQATRSSRAKSMPEWVAQATSVQPLVTRSSCADNMPEVATNARPTEPTQVASSSGQPNQADEWAWMIGNLWETVEWKEKSRKARESRLKMSWNHTSGSRSFLAPKQAKRTSFLEGLVLQLAERVGMDPGIVLGGEGTSGGARDTTSL